MLKKIDRSINGIVFFSLTLYASLVYFSVFMSNIFLISTLCLYLYGCVKNRITLTFKFGNVFFFFALISPFLLTIVTTYFSNTKEFAWSFLLMRFPILIFCFILLTLSLSWAIAKKALYIFVIASLLASLVVFLMAIYSLIENSVLILGSDITEGFITRIQHPYFGIFQLIALLTTFEFDFFKNKWIKYLAISLLFFGAVISASRIVWLLTFIIGYYYISSYFVSRYINKIIAIIVLFLLSVVMFSSNTIKTKFVNTFTYWDSPRVLLWHNSYKVLKYSNQKFRGIGIGDYYRIKRGPENFINSQRGVYGYNPHNQHLEFIITNGIFGLCFLISICYLIFYCYQNSNYYSFGLLIIILFFSFTECIFNRQFGIQLYSIFAPFSIIMVDLKKELEK